MLPASVVKSSAPTITGEPLIAAGADDDAVGRDLTADQRAELAERARVEQALDPRAGVELALAVMLVEPLGPAHRPRVLTAALEILERLLPVRRLSVMLSVLTLDGHDATVALTYDMLLQGHILDCLL